jgi:peptidoglycan/LPS O-acetylase OafA/YrhL
VPDRWRWKLAGVLVLLAPLIRWLWASLAGAAMSHPDAGGLAFSVYASTICQMDAFLFGALLARFQQELVASIRRMPAPWLWLALGPIAVYGFACMVLNHARGDRGMDVLKNIFSGILHGQGRELILYSVIDLLAFGILAATLAGARGTGWLSRPWITWVGRISYGGYLFHALVIQGFNALIGQELRHAPVALRFAGFGAVFVTTAVLASLSFVHFEQPIARRFKAWAARRAGTRGMTTMEH